MDRYAVNSVWIALRFRDIRCSFLVRLVSNAGDQFLNAKREKTSWLQLFLNSRIFKAECYVRGQPRTRRLTCCFASTSGRRGANLMARLSSVVASAARPASPTGDTWVSVALSSRA